jgi:D-3-phosphoglycerate dehydrogenase / 2-oxoglutarate reductase
MKILLTTTSFVDTPGSHQELLKKSKYELDILRGPLKEEVLLPIISKYDGVICGDDEFTKKVLFNGKNGSLKVISKYGIGLDKIDLKAANEYKIPVFNTPGVNHIAVSEHIIALIFAYYKNIHLEHQITQHGKWDRLIGNEIYGKKIGILGFGRIGKELLKRTEAMGMNTIVYDPYVDKKHLNNNNISFARTLEDLIQNDLDILALTLPLTDSTNGIINVDLINKAKKNMVIVNTSRAFIVDQESLIYLLQQKKIKAYLTDVLEEEPMIKDHPLLKFNNVIITPHIGSRTYESVQRQGTMAVNNLLKFLNKWEK